MPTYARMHDMYKDSSPDRSSAYLRIDACEDGACVTSPRRHANLQRSALHAFFFFSSRRRHTRFDCDWSSDVCSSDLDPRALGGKEILILSTHGGIRSPDGTPVALGYHTGHWEVGLLMEAAAQELKAHGAVPFAASCTDPCDGRTQGTTGMFDSLPYRNDAASVFRRLIRSLPTRSGVLGVATCDKGLPAMMMALAAMHDLPCVLIPGGVTLLAEEGEDAGRVQSVGARFAHNQISLEDAAENLCRACATPGGGCQFLGTAATSQVVGEALGLALTHSALAPSGHPIWLDMARRSARAVRSEER